MTGADATGSGARTVAAHTVLAPRGTTLWPVEIRVKSAERVVEIDFDDAGTIDTRRISFELLRVESPSAEVQGHHPSQKRIIGGKRDVGITGADPVGNYAVRLRFSDGHDTGIFSWQYLDQLTADQDRIWHDYLAALEAAGGSRDHG